MKWLLDKSRPISPKIYEKICFLISCGEIKPGDKLMSVREVALTAEVTPNTVQKSFEQLENSGVIFSKRGSGWYVSDNVEAAKKTVAGIIAAKTKDYILEMRALGLSEEKIILAIKECKI